MTLQFSPNLTLLYNEHPFADRFSAAADDGWGFVEFWPQEDVALGVARARAANLQVEILSVATGTGGDHGRLAHPDATEWWRAEFHRTLATAVDAACHVVCLIVGNRQAGVPDELHWATARSNLEWALAEIDELPITLVIEPLNRNDRPEHLLTTTGEAIALSESLGDPPKLRVLFDAYHLDQSDGSVPDLLSRCGPRVGYVQFADSPGRHEPGTGSIDVARFLQAIEDSPYTGPVGLELIPTGSTRDALRFFREYQQ